MVKKLIAGLLVVASIAIVFSGCQKNPNSSGKNLDYSVGLDENGFYDGVENVDFDVDSLMSMKFSSEDILQFGASNLGESVIKEYGLNKGTSFDTNAYVEMYASQLLGMLGVNKKDVAEHDDIVNATLVFVDEKGNPIEGYKNEKVDYTANKNGDEITKSFVGKKVGDKYTVDYLLKESESDKGRSVKVNVEIHSISWADPFNHNVLEDNLAEIQKTFPGVKDRASYLDTVKPLLVKKDLNDYLSNYMRAVTMDVPKEYLDAEKSRLMVRLNKLGYTYEQYLKENKSTEEDVAKTIRENAIENIVCMKIYLGFSNEVTDEDLNKKYGEAAIDTIIAQQGKPYAKLRVIREKALVLLSESIEILY